MEAIEIEGGPPRFSRDKLRDEVRACVEGSGVLRAILFGSYARGDADACSDVDLVLIERTSRPFVERGLAHLALFKLGVGVDLLVYTPEEWVRLERDGNPLIERIVREGVTVYARSEG